MLDEWPAIWKLSGSGVLGTGPQPMVRAYISIRQFAWVECTTLTA